MYNSGTEQGAALTVKQEDEALARAIAASLEHPQAGGAAAAAASFSSAEGGTVAQLPEKDFSKELQDLFVFVSSEGIVDGHIKAFIEARDGLLEDMNLYLFIDEERINLTTFDQYCPSRVIKNKIFTALTLQGYEKNKIDNGIAYDSLHLYRTQITELARVKGKKEIPYEEINNLLNSLIQKISINIETPASMPAAQQDAWDNLLGHGQVGGSESVDPSQGGGAAAAAPEETTSARQENPKATFLNHVAQLNTLYRCQSKEDSMLRSLQKQIFGVNKAGRPNGNINSLYGSLNLAAAKNPATSVPAAALKTEERAAAGGSAAEASAPVVKSNSLPWGTPVFSGLLSPKKWTQKEQTEKKNREELQNFIYNSRL